MLDDVAKEKGIDLDGELLKRDVLRKPNKSFRKKMEEEMFKKCLMMKKQIRRSRDSSKQNIIIKLPQWLWGTSPQNNKTQNEI